jgi:hypothetical protein
VAKRKLTDLLGGSIAPKETDSQTYMHTSSVAPKETDSQTYMHTSSVAPKETDSQTYIHTSSVTPKETEFQTQEPGIPLYQKLIRKEARLTEFQIEGLERLARRLNRNKRDKTAPRITENTLIRVAVAYLLSRAEGLKGATEEELLQSLEDTDLLG